MTWIALLRGINVGGHNKLSMKALGDTLSSMGLQNIRTYIQSGNVVFSTPRRSAAKLASEVEQQIDDRHGFRPAVLLLSHDELAAAASANPYASVDAEPKTVHMWFLASRPDHPDIAGMNALKSPSEQFALKGAVFYLYAPDGIGRSKLAAKAERLLGVAGTGRNWRTVQKLLELAE